MFSIMGSPKRMLALTMMSTALLTDRDAFARDLLEQLIILDWL